MHVVMYALTYYLYTTFCLFDSMALDAGVLVAYIAFRDVDVKSRAEGFLSSITNSMEIVLRQNVEVRLGLVPGGEKSLSGRTPVKLADSMTPKQLETIRVMDTERERDCNKSHGSADRSSPAAKTACTAQKKL